MTDFMIYECQESRSDTIGSAAGGNMRLSIVFVILLFIGCSNSLDEKEIKSNTSFAMSNKLIGSIIQSSDKNDIGNVITFIGLNSDNPEVLFESGMGRVL